MKTYNYLISSLFIFLLTIQYSFANNTEDALSHYGKAHELIEKGQLEEAAEELYKAVELKPDFYYDAYFSLYNVLKELNKNEEAETIDREISKLKSFDKRFAYHALGVMLFGAKNYAGAVKEFKEALKVYTLEKVPFLYALIQNDLGMAYLYLSESGNKEDNLKLAMEAFNEALKVFTFKESPNVYAGIKNNLSKAYWSLSEVKDKENNISQAIEHYKGFLECFPKDPNARTIMGYLLCEVGRYEGGANEYREALRLRPDAPNAPEIHFNLGNALAGQEKLEEAGREYREAIGLRPDYIDAYVNLGNTLQALNLYKFEESKRLKRFEDAEDAYLKAIKLKPASFEAHYSLGFLLDDLGRYTEAESEYREALDIRPNFANAHFLLGNVLVERKNFNDAENEFGTALRLDQDHLGARSGLASLLVKLGRPYGDAEKEFKEILESKYLKALCPDYKGIRDLNLLLKELVREEEFVDRSKKMQKVAAKVCVWQSLLGLSHIHVGMAGSTGEAGVFQGALDELDGALSIAKTRPDYFGKENLLNMYLNKGHILTNLGNYNGAKQAFEECKNYDRDNPKVKRNLRRIDDIMFWRWIWKIIFLTVTAGTILYFFAFLKYFRFRESKSKYVASFYISIFVFIIMVIIEIGILPPSITNNLKVYIGCPPIVFELGEFPIQSIKRAMESEWMTSPRPQGL